MKSLGNGNLQREIDCRKKEDQAIVDDPKRNPNGRTGLHERKKMNFQID